MLRQLPGALRRRVGRPVAAADDHRWSRSTSEPVAVFIGALAALLLVSGLAVVAGRQLQRFVKLHVLHYVGAGVCLLLAAITAYELLA